MIFKLLVYLLVSIYKKIMSACADKTFSLVIHKRNEIMLMHPTVFEQNRPH